MDTSYKLYARDSGTVVGFQSFRISVRTVNTIGMSQLRSYPKKLHNSGAAAPELGFRVSPLLILAFYSFVRKNFRARYAREVTSIEMIMS